ncbi:hypothetical protein JJC00_18720 [Bradyrhizobium diazoefficiens]|uniref:hypothetical protein n=1 Tax=Bradyrhizobium diazoefficiens TaxID=1355477 RepID=UPI00190C47DE|nr:hypothetical protein [Bradyrhizobium diazoefficiens]QQO37463.1 hypothetical protein JJC00_18720 [Bradyrhizobium diazoefficiens]
MDIEDAIEAAAGDRNAQISADPCRSRSARLATARARSTIAAFLDVVPDDMTVFELKELLERGN